MRAKQVAALARTVLFRRVRTLLVRPHEDGMTATTLNYDYEVRPAADAFDDIPDIDIKNEMLELAEHIIRTKKGTFDPAAFDDRYEAALADLVKAKMEGRKIEVRKERRRAEPVDLMAALRESAGMAAGKSAAGKQAKAAARSGSGKSKAPAARRKTG